MITCQQQVTLVVSGSPNLFSALVWDNPIDVNTGNGTQNTFTGPDITISTSNTAANGQVITTNGNNLLAYAGPLVNCNIRTTYLNDPFNLNGFVNVFQDGNQILGDDLCAGTFVSGFCGAPVVVRDHPFQIAATPGSQIDIQVGLSTSAGNHCSVEAVITSM